MKGPALAVVAVVVLIIIGIAGGDSGDNGESSDAPDADAAIRAEAENFCPRLDDDFLESCLDSYVSLAQSERCNNACSLLCVDDAGGTWYFTTPGATPILDFVPPQVGNEASQVGDDCREPGHSAVALVGG